MRAIIIVHVVITRSITISGRSSQYIYKNIKQFYGSKKESSKEEVSKESYKESSKEKGFKEEAIIAHSLST
jgi:hypothetical protein